MTAITMGSAVGAGSEYLRPAFRGVHVVTVTHNSASTVERYVRALAADAGHIAGVTVVDNGSTDDTLALLRAALRGLDLPVEVLEHENTGFAGGYAAAAASRFARGVPVLCLNPDVILAAGAVESMVEVLNDFPDAAIATVPLVESDGSPDTASRRRLPTLGGSMIYSVLGRLTPRAWRYNRRTRDETPEFRGASGVRVSPLEATTGAVMLVAPDFRSLDEGVFDQDYWMYGEDLQLCADARAAGRSVLMAEVAPSVHVKGVSSGRPRSRVANRAFHDAMLQYARKNLVSSPFTIAALRAAVALHFAFSEVRATPARKRAARRSG